MPNRAIKIQKLEQENKELHTQLEIYSLNASKEKNIQQNQLFKSITNAIDGLLYYKDLNYKYTGCNQAFCEFVGVDITKIIGKTDYELFDKAQADISRTTDTEVVKTLMTQSSYETLKHTNGQELHLLTKKSPLLDESKNIIGLVGFSRDDAENYSLTQKLQRTSNFLAYTQSLAKIGHWEWDIKSGNITCSDEIFRIFGFEKQAFIPTYDFFLKSIYPKDKNRVSDAIKYSLKYKTIYDMRHKIVLPDGSLKIVLEIGHATYDKNDNPLSVLGIIQDITKIIKTENKLAEKIELSQSIFNYSNDGIVLFHDGKFYDCNKSALKMIKVSNKEELLKLTPEKISPKYQPDGKLSSEKIQAAIEKCYKKGIAKFEWMFTNLDGEDFLVEVLLSKIELQDRNIIHASLRDISKRKKLESDLLKSNYQYKSLIHDLDHRVKEQSAQLIKQSKMAQMGELISMIAHQWRQPLSSISVAAISLKMRLDLFDLDNIDHKNVESIHNYSYQKLEDISRYVQSLSSTIDDFRNLYDTGKKFKEHSIHQPIDEAIELVQLNLMEDNVKVERLYQVTSKISMQKSEIMQVIISIMKNSMDNFKEHHKQNPLISIKTVEFDKYISVEIDDNGSGIDKAIIEKIFDPYFSTKDAKNGTGLGLYMSKIIIEKTHNGKLYVKSTKFGSSFYIELPKSIS